MQLTIYILLVFAWFSLISGDHMISISLGGCVQEETTEVICTSNSSSLFWKIDNHTIINSMVEGWTYRIVPSERGLLYSTLVMNLTFRSIRSSMREVKCCNEKSFCLPIYLEYNGTCMDEVTIDQHISTSTSTNLATEYHQHGNSGFGRTTLKVLIISCVLLTMVSFLCISMTGLLWHFQTRSNCRNIIRASSDEETGNHSQRSIADYSARQSQGAHSLQETTNLLGQKSKGPSSVPPPLNHKQNTGKIIQKSSSEEEFKFPYVTIACDENVPEHMQ